MNFLSAFLFFIVGVFSAALPQQEEYTQAGFYRPNFSAFFGPLYAEKSCSESLYGLNYSPAAAYQVWGDFKCDFYRDAECKDLALGAQPGSSGNFPEADQPIRYTCTRTPTKRQLNAGWWKIEPDSYHVGLYTDRSCEDSPNGMFGAKIGEYTVSEGYKCDFFSDSECKTLYRSVTGRVHDVIEPVQERPIRYMCTSA